MNSIFLPNTSIEILDPNLFRGHIRHALFDFDGTISLIREGWQQVMIPMMVDILLELRTGESEEELVALVTEFVDRLTGKQTIYQMIQLCEEVRQRGGNPLGPLEYKWTYLDRLWERIKGRVAALKEGQIEPEQMVVPGSIDILEAMRAHEVTCYLASGTDESYVLDEAEALGVTPYFTGVYGALDDYSSYSKRMMIDRIIKENHLKGHANLYPVFCSFAMQQVMPLSDAHPFNANYVRQVKRWMTMLPRGCCYDYIGWYPGPWTLFHNLEADQSFYRKLGFTGNVSEYLDRNVGTDVFMWLSFKQMWNPQQKVDDLLDEFYPAYFGPAAGVMREIYESFEKHMLSVGGSGEVSDVARLYPVAMIEDALAKIAAAKAGLDDKTILARLERDENQLRLTRLFLDFWAASDRFRNGNKEKDRQQTIEAGQSYLDLIRELVGTLSLGGAYRAYVERVQADFSNPGTVFTKAGEFTYDDYYNDGGNVHQALRRSGYTISPNGLSLKANTTGELVYDFRTGEDLVFQEARLRYMHFYRYAGDHNKIEISRDGGKTWATAYKDVNWSGYSAEYDLTKYIVGANSFLLRFWHRSGPNALLGIDNLGVVGTIAPAGEVVAKP